MSSVSNTIANIEEITGITAETLLDAIEELFDGDLDSPSHMIQKLCEEFLHALDAVFLDRLPEEQAFEYVNQNFTFLLQEDKLYVQFSMRDGHPIAQAMESLVTIVDSSINGDYDYVHENCPDLLKTLERFSNPLNFHRIDSGRLEIYIPFN